MSNQKPESRAFHSESPRERLLAAAVKLFAERGFERSSMRDLAAATGMSLAGLYHHFASKDELLYEIQHHAFAQLLAPLAELSAEMPPADRVAFLIGNHLEFFTHHITEMKVLSHELETLRGELGNRIERLRGDYYRLCRDLVTELLEANGRDDLDPRVTTMSLFGMVNWIYRWSESVPAESAESLAHQMTDLFLHGVCRAT